MKPLWIGIFWVAFVTSTCAMDSAAEFSILSHENHFDWMPAGKETDAIAGDFVLRNEHVIVVIAQPAPWRHANLTVKNVGGMVLDFTGREVQSDQLSCFYPTANRFNFHAADRVSVKLDGVEKDWKDAAGPLSGQEVSLTFVSATAGNGVVCELTYRLCSTDQFLEITTSFRNESDKLATVLLRDSFRCDQLFQDGLVPETDLFWCYDPWFEQAYGVTCEGYVPQRGAGRGPLVEWLDSNGKNRVRVKNGESFTFVRRLWASRDLLSLRGRVSQHSGQASSDTVFTVSDQDGGVERAKVGVKLEGEDWGWGYTDREGRITWPTPHGELAITVDAVGREQTALTLMVDAPLERKIAVERASGIEVKVSDSNARPLPFKVGIYGTDSSTAPDFGPESLAFAMRNVLYTADGTVRHALDPGTYELVVSHGPEYDAEVVRITVEPGQLTRVATTLKHVVNSAGWVSAEYHSHSSPSGDNTGSQLGRVLNLLAEQIEFAPCTEHNRVDTYQRHLETLGSQHRMATCAGIELTGDSLPVNHQNAFPMVLRPLTQDNGGPRIDINPIVQIERLALWDDGSEKFVQSNHPNLRQIFGDGNANGVADDGFREMFAYMDAMEVHPPAMIFQVPPLDLDPAQRGNAVFNWMQLLNRGYRIPGVVNTDAHYNFHGSGWLRNFVASSTDEPSEIDVIEMVRNSERGRIVMSTGPFLEVTAVVEDKVYPIGSDVHAVDGNVELDVRVQCPNWLDVNRLQVFANGRPLTEHDYRRRTHPTMFGNGVVKFEQSISLELSEDTHLIVATIGEGLKLGRVMGETWGNRAPVAIANPIFVDVDGNGFQANGDDLDRPLPVIAR